MAGLLLLSLFLGKTRKFRRANLDLKSLIVGYDDDPGDYEYMGIQLSTDHRQLFISDPAEFDFNDDGIEEPAQASLEFVRN